MSAGISDRPELAPLVLDGVVPYPEEIAARYRREGIWADQTLGEMLFEVVDRTPDHTAIIAGERRITYAELGQRVLGYAAGFSRLGIGRGDRVVLHLPNVSDYVPILFGLFEVGAIPVLALAALRRHEIEYFVEFTEARAYITIESHAGNDFAALARDLAASSPTLEHTVVLSADGGGRDVEELLSHGIATRRRRSLAVRRRLPAIIRRHNGTAESDSAHPRGLPGVGAGQCRAVRDHRGHGPAGRICRSVTASPCGRPDSSVS